MDKERKETGRLSYFSLALTDFLASDHPDKIEDTGLIQARCRMAEERFCEASREGYGVQEAYEEARKELFRGLHFSPYIMTRDIIIIAAARGEGESIKHHEYDSPNLHCFHFRFLYFFI